MMMKYEFCICVHRTNKYYTHMYTYIYYVLVVFTLCIQLSSSGTPNPSSWKITHDLNVGYIPELINDHVLISKGDLNKEQRTFLSFE